MGFFDQLKDNAMAAAEQAKILAKQAGEKAEAAVEIQKLSRAIDKNKSSITANYLKLGQYVYQQCKSNISLPEEISANVDAITAALAEIEKLTKAIAVIKQEQFGGAAPDETCASCGGSVAAGANFCPHCGAPVEKPAAAPEEEPAEAATVETVPVEEAPAEETPVAEAPAEAATVIEEEKP